jgi:hypothetical protein
MVGNRWVRSRRCESNACVEVKWSRSRECDNSACVEVLEEYGNVLVRNSKSPGHTVVFDTEEWTEFLEAVKRGEFDL